MHTIAQIIDLFTCMELSCTELRRIQRLIGFEQEMAEVTARTWYRSLGGSSPLCANYNISTDKATKSKHNK